MGDEDWDEKEVREERGEEFDESILEAGDLVNFFVKTIKSSRLFPPENPSLLGFRQQLFKKFQEFLAKYQQFRFQIDEYSFSFQGKNLYENPDLKTSLPFFFYKDGLRELRFIEGLEEREIQELLDLITQGDNLNPLEDDLVTLLWEKDFPHIGYLATDEFLEETSVLVPENVEQFRKNLIFDQPAHSMEGDFWGEEEPAAPEKTQQKIDGPLAVSQDRKIYSLTAEEWERLQKEVESALSPTAIFSVLDTLWEIIALEKEPEPFQEAIILLQKMLDLLLNLGEFKRASDLLIRMNLILKTFELKSWQLPLLEQFFESAGDASRVERLGKTLEKGEGIKLDEVKGFIALLKKNSIPSLIQLLGELSHLKNRRAICDVLCETGKDSLEFIIPFLDDPRWFLVRNVTYILGRMGKEQAIPALQKNLNHSEWRVRREAAQALGLIRSSRVLAPLKKALTDDVFRVRTMAAMALAKVGKNVSFPILLEVVQSKDFSKKTPEEIKGFFEAIGITGAREAVPALQRMLEQKGWFGGGRKEVIQFGAASALALIGTPEAKSVLEAGKNSKDGIVRQACTQAMRRQTS